MAHGQPRGESSSELVRRIQEAPNDPIFNEFYQRMNPLLAKHKRLIALKEDDKEDILSDTWVKIWKGLPEFSYKSEKKLENWMTRILTNTTNDFYKRSQTLKRKMVEVSLNQPFQTENGEELYLEEVLTVNWPDNETELDIAQREQACEIAKQCLANEKQVELVKRRIQGEKLPPEWSQNWVNVNWYRAKTQILKFLNKRNNK